MCPTTLFFFSPPTKFLFPLGNILVKYAQISLDYILAIPIFYTIYYFMYLEKKSCPKLTKNKKGGGGEGGRRSREGGEENLFASNF